MEGGASEGLFGMMERDTTRTDAPLDAGFSFAILHAPLLLALALPPLAVDGIVAYLRFTTPLPAQEIFLLSVVSFAASCWLLTVTAMTCAQAERGRARAPLGLAFGGFRHLPKVVFSVLFLIFTIAVAVAILPLLVLVVFFVWAPFFCIGEFLVPQVEPSDEEQDDRYYDEEEEVEELPKFFTKKSLFDLGFSRSLRLGTKFPGVTVQIFLLIWFANVVPAALVQLVAPDYSMFLFEFLAIAGSSIAEVFVFAIAGATFFRLLSKDARREIDLPLPLSEPRPPAASRGRMIAFGAVAVIAFLSTLFLVKELRAAHSMPESVTVRFESARAEDKSLIVTLSMTDELNQFRWLNPSSFRVMLPALQPETPPAAAHEPAGVPAAEAGPTSTPVRHIAIFNEKGDELGFSELSPQTGTLKMILNFEFSEAVPKEGEFVLNYVSLFDDATKVYEGRYGTGS